MRVLILLLVVMLVPVYVFAFDNHDGSYRDATILKMIPSSMPWINAEFGLALKWECRTEELSHGES